MRARQLRFGWSCIACSVFGILGYGFLIARGAASYWSLSPELVLVLGILLLGVEQVIQPHRERMSRVLFLAGSALTLVASAFLFARISLGA